MLRRQRCPHLLPQFKKPSKGQNCHGRSLPYDLIFCRITIIRKELCRPGYRFHTGHTDDHRIFGLVQSPLQHLQIFFLTGRRQIQKIGNIRCQRNIKNPHMSLAALRHSCKKYQDDRRIEFISRTLMTPYVGFHSASAEVRAASAIDIALWDLFGKHHQIPVHEALGGASRQSIQVYNTCSGYVFNASSSAYNSGSSRRVITQKDVMRGPYDDQVAFNQDAGKLAESLLAEGYRVMKIWPFDPFAKKTQGNWISDEDLQAGLEPFQKIRAAVGNKMEIMCELHSLWSLPAAIRICQALEPYHIFWAEDPLCKMDDIAQLKDLRSKTRTPICGSETLAGAVTFRQMFAAGAFDYAMIDLGWCGGLTEGRKICALAESYNIPLAPHDCTGPVLLWAGLHLALRPEVKKRKDAIIRESGQA